MTDPVDVVRRLESLHKEGLPADAEQRERERLQRIARGKLPRGERERDVERAEKRKKLLAHLWHWHHEQLLLAAEGSIASLFDRVTGGESDGRPGGFEERLREIEGDWELARTNRERQIAVERLQELHRDILLQKPDALNPKTEEWRRAIAHDPRPSRTVARIYGISQSTVINYRAEFAGEAKGLK